MKTNYKTNQKSPLWRILFKFEIPSGDNLKINKFFEFICFSISAIGILKYKKEVTKNLNFYAFYWEIKFCDGDNLKINCGILSYPNVLATIFSFKFSIFSTGVMKYKKEATKIFHYYFCHWQIESWGGDNLKIHCRVLNYYPIFSV